MRKQYQMLLSDGFPYLMITPGFILLVFVVIFPILLVLPSLSPTTTCTTPPAKLVDWVGLKNFVNIFTLPSGAPPSGCAAGTVVWTLLATTLQCTVACCWRFWSTKKICALNR